MPTGREVYEDLQNKISKVESDRERQLSGIRSKQRRIERLHSEKDSLYFRLAQIYLPEMSPESIQGTLEEVRERVGSIFREKGQRRIELEKMISNTSEERARVQENLLEVRMKIDAKLEEQDEVRDKIDTELKADYRYTGLVVKADQAGRRLEQGQARANAFRTETQAKLRDFEGDKLFMYLIKRNFGERSAKGNSLTRKLDAWVAEIVDFGKNKRNYDFLRTMPVKMDEEISRQTEEFKGYSTKIKRIEVETEKKHGLPTILEDGKKIEATRSELNRKIGQLNISYDHFQEELESLENTRGEYYGEAIESLTRHLKGQDIDELRARATVTPDPRDDGITEDLYKINAELGKEEGSLPPLLKAQAKLTTQLKELRSIESEFSSRDYNSSRSRFSSGFDLNHLIIAYLAGRMNIGSVKSEMDSAQHFKSRETYRSYSNRSSSDSSSSSSFSSSSFSSGGGFGGGGFSTGGGF